MREDNYQEWVKLVTRRPHVLAIFLRLIFAPKEDEDKCECRENGQMYIEGNLNRCGNCARSFCTFDSHLFLGTMPISLIGWLSVVLEGNSNIKTCIKS